jgi:hypothetical protein
MDVVRTVSSFDTGLTLAFWLLAGEQAIYARHASRVLAPQRLMELPEQIPGAEASQFRLLGTRRFLPFVLTQFLGAFNDNLFRNAVVVSITFGATVAGRDAGILSNVSQGLFILPFFLFSALSGQLADRTRSRVLSGNALREVVLMCAGAVALYSGEIPHDAHRDLPVEACWPPFSAHSRYSLMHNTCARASWWAATRWWTRAPSSPFSSARSRAALLAPTPSVEAAASGRQKPSCASVTMVAVAVAHVPVCTRHSRAGRPIPTSKSISIRSPRPQ